MTLMAMANGPDAVGRLSDGKVVLVRGAAPGDHAQIEILEENKTLARGRVLRRIISSADRREPRCRHARSRECGGCPWQHLDEAAQRREKQTLIEREVARIDPTAEVRPIRSDVPAFGYRRRARLGHRGSRLGYRRPGQRKIFDLLECPILEPTLEGSIAGIRAAVAGRESGNVDVLLDSAGDVIVDGPARIFAQPSAAAEAVLVELVLAAVPAEPLARVAELFCGAGTFTLPLLERGHPMSAWELDRRAVARLRERAPTAEVHRADLMRAPLDLELTGAESVVLDPPRAGAAAAVPAILRSGASTVVYVSCDPMTLCRDLAGLCAGGYRIDYVQPVDAFPQTHHTECVARLSATEALPSRLQMG